MNRRIVTFGISLPPARKGRWSTDTAISRIKAWCRKQKRDITSSQVAKEFETSQRYAAHCLSRLEGEGLLIRAGWGKKTRGGKMPILWDLA